MLKNLTKKQVHTLLEFLDTLASLGLSPGYTIIWDLRPRTFLDIRWNITRDDPRSLYDVSIRAEFGSLHKLVIDIAEDAQ